MHGEDRQVREIYCYFKAGTLEDYLIAMRR